MKHVDLEKFANGAFSAQVNRAIEEVTENIQNPNTDAGATRKITVTIAFKPNAERNFVATGVQTKTTLAPALGAVTAFSMGKNLQTGEVEAIEMGNQIPGQMSVNDVPGVVPENVVEVEGKAVDPSCVNTIKEIQQWKWKKDERTNTYLEEPVPFFDDAMAMLRYSIEEERKAKPKLNRNLKGGL